MDKRKHWTIIFAALSLAFAVASVILFVAGGAKFLEMNLAFYLCLIGFGGATVTACALIIFKKETEDVFVCPNCGATLDADAAFCKKCGKPIEKEEN